MTFYFGSIAMLSFAYDSRMFLELFGFLMDVSSCLVDDGVSPRIVERKVRMRFIFGQHALGDRYENLESRCVRLLIARCILVWLRRLLRTRKISVHINRPGKPFKRIAHWKICNRPIFLLFLLFIFIYFPLFIWNADERGVEWSDSFCVKRNEVVIDREAGWTKGSSINSWLVSSYIKNLERQNKINGFIVNLPCRIFSDVVVHTYVFYDPDLHTRCSSLSSPIYHFVYQSLLNDITSIFYHFIIPRARLYFYILLDLKISSARSIWDVSRRNSRGTSGLPAPIHNTIGNVFPLRLF